MTKQTSLGLSSTSVKFKSLPFHSHLRCSCIFSSHIAACLVSLSFSNLLLLEINSSFEFKEAFNGKNPFHILLQIKGLSTSPTLILSPWSLNKPPSSFLLWVLSVIVATACYITTNYSCIRSSCICLLLL